ncbi:MAG: Co2+/Mg2+ efflux protein ApaG [Nannocystaceae bacterium]
MTTSEALTEGIRVRVVSRYSPDHSQPSQRRWLFTYTVKIANEGEETVQLLSRRWLITDAKGRVEEVEGPGVVGVQPVLPPGESFEYTSFCPLPTAFGTMEGSYKMVRAESGEAFDAVIAPFTLSTPYAVN